jgi:hypothetical protein
VYRLTKESGRSGRERSMTGQQESMVINECLPKLRELVGIRPDLIHAWRFAVSAVWALENYYRLRELPESADRPDDYLADTLENIGRLERLDGFTTHWERGFWYNAAIMRLDALWERLFKAMGPTTNDLLYQRVKAVCPEALPDSWEQSSFFRIREVVNSLKHEPTGADAAIREQQQLPFEMLRDLLKVVDALRSHGG